mgnify:CR=1 FL=1
MSRFSGFNSPFLLGFDHFERILENASKASAEGYPPYNIEQIGDNGLCITLAVAGFTLDDINVSVEDNQLVIRGRNSEDETGRVFLHRGIAARHFQRSFVLAEGIEVLAASMNDGLLHINLERHVPEPEVRTVKIESGSPKGRARAQTIELETDDS